MLKQARRHLGRHGQYGRVEPFAVDLDAVGLRRQTPHRVAVAHGGLAGRHVGPQRRQVGVGQQQIAVAPVAGQAVAQDVRVQQGAGLRRRRVQGSQAQGRPDGLADAGGLAGMVQQLRDGPVARRLPLHLAQVVHEPHGGHARAPGQAARQQQRGGGVQGGGQGRRRQAKAAVQAGQPQRPAHQQRIRVASQAAHQRQGFAIGAQQDVLAVVQVVAELRVDHAAGAPAGRAPGFEHGDLGVGLAQRHAGGQAGPARSDDGDLHRASRRTRGAPPLTQVFQASHSLRTGVSEMRWCSTCQSSRSISSSSAW
ncbi:Uncharacterised protein [Bordetella pertussis]|nr:Uncharacterised protein [Bordetella pertussis]CFN92467.1 Uncharacterised protein [Bordetella pertussis]CFO62277.1 Uncharacterised protein [Bordetella pertussis]CFO74713.1 Uncharacterised protein [Bordetella pertussis]CFV93764.1 Uncharacterised protein [Bordetella pertussis]